jgi:DNA mismatch repair protein MutS
VAKLAPDPERMSVRPDRVAPPAKRRGSSSADGSTPGRRQYLTLKSQNPDALLLFRMGDFYETFDEDAETAAAELGIALTSRSMGKNEGRIPLAGIPYHQLERYLERLVSAGHRVAIAEQVSEPGNGLVERRVVRVVTPGTVESGSLLPPEAHNWLAALAPATLDVDGAPRWALAACDVTTGELELQLLSSEELPGEWARLAPRELLLPRDARLPDGGRPEQVLVTERPVRAFDVVRAADAVAEQLGVATLDGFGIEGFEPALGAAGALIDYLGEAWPGALAHLRPPRAVRGTELVTLDAQTRRNLELFEPSRSGGSGASLVAVLDETRTAMGARLLRQRLGRPLRRRDPLERRLEEVAAFVEAGGPRQSLREALRGLPDVERLLGRVRAGTAHARHLLQLRLALECLPAVAEAGRAAGTAPSALIEGALGPAGEPAAAIAAALSDDPPADPADGDTVRVGFDSEVDRLRALASGAREQLAALETAERARTGLNSLKAGYHRVFGYYLELPRSQADRAPADYEPRQTLAATQRFRFAPLTALESEILEAKDLLLAAERAVLDRLRGQIAAAGPALVRAAEAVAALDVAAALATIAVDYGYVRPELADAGALEIEGGRHPVVERQLAAGAFVPNDVILGADADLVLLTGPNMGGKSTYLRQTALIVLLAQCGSFVPADRARVPLADRIFSRVGAQDDLAAGQSTFMVEMVETAAILHEATEHSLVILDEVGRGTATHDGLAIAQAVVEHLHHRPAGTPRTLFATHYHELTALAGTLPRIANRSVAVSEAHGEVVFLHRIVDGGADRSYGVHVAALAGLPRPVVARARELLHALERDGTASVALTGASAGDAAIAVPLQPTPEPLLDELAALEPDALTPLEALQRLYELRAAARRRRGDEG